MELNEAHLHYHEAQLSAKRHAANSPQTGAIYAELAKAAALMAQSIVDKERLDFEKEKFEKTGR